MTISTAAAVGSPKDILINVPTQTIINAIVKAHGPIEASAPVIEARQTQINGTASSNMQTYDNIRIVLDPSGNDGFARAEVDWDAVITAGLAAVYPSTP